MAGPAFRVLIRSSGWGRDRRRQSEGLPVQLKKWVPRGNSQSLERWKKVRNHATFSMERPAGGACSSVSRGVQSGSNSWLVYHHFSWYTSVVLILRNVGAEKQLAPRSAARRRLRRTSLDHNIATICHEANLLSIQARHPAHPGSAPVKIPREQRLSLVAVVEVCQDRFGPRVRGPDQRHV